MRNLSTRILLGSSALLLLAGRLHAAQPPPVSPIVFEGNYKLTYGTVGICEDPLVIDSFAADDGTLNVNVGGFFFPHVNGAPQFNHDYLGESASKAYVLSDTTSSPVITQLVVKLVDIDNADKSKSTTVTSATLKGTKLNVKSMTKILQGGSVTTTDLNCTYHPVSCNEMPWGCE